LAQVFHLHVAKNDRISLTFFHHRHYVWYPIYNAMALIWWWSNQWLW